MHSLFYKKYYFSKQTLRRKKKEKSTMSFVHVNNHPQAETLFVACCKMPNKHLIAGYHHDITSRVWILTCLPVYDEDNDDDPDMKLQDLYDSNMNQNSKVAKWDALI